MKALVLLITLAWSFVIYDYYGFYTAYILSLLLGTGMAETINYIKINKPL